MMVALLLYAALSYDDDSVAALLCIQIDRNIYKQTMVAEYISSRMNSFKTALEGVDGCGKLR